MTVSHSGLLLPDVGAEPARTTTSIVPVPPRMSSMARVIEAVTMPPAPFMVNAGPFHALLLTSDALPSLILSAAAWAG
ncbi:hypothetical protein GCM10010282_54190 [Streptomyces roseolus]|nr:hypothetical protein GCM10010282_54190 [Streptomyces roseolus]